LTATVVGSTAFAYIPFIAAQLIGATLAAGLARLLFAPVSKEQNAIESTRGNHRGIIVR
jgi:hypothetical protein